LRCAGYGKWQVFQDRGKQRGCIRIRCCTGVVDHLVLVLLAYFDAHQQFVRDVTQMLLVRQLDLVEPAVLVAQDIAATERDGRHSEQIVDRSGARMVAVQRVIVIAQGIGHSGVV
jgi:hypothetical protein